MLMRKTQYAWMAVGGLICLFSLVLACKLRDGNKAIAQAEKIELPPMLDTNPKAPADKPPMMNPPLPMPSMMTKPTIAREISSGPMLIEPEKPRPPKKNESKARLDMPTPIEPPMMPKSPSTPPLPPSTGPLLPVSFGPNTPTMPIDKTAKDKSKVRSPKTPDVAPVPTAKLLQPLGPQSVLPQTTSAMDPTPIAPATPAVGSIKVISPAGTPPLPGFTPDKKPAPPSSLSSLRTLIIKPASEASNENKLAPAAFDPLSGPPPSPSAGTDHEASKTQPGEPPLAPAPGPVQLYHVHGTETLQDIARRTLGSNDRCGDLLKLNPTLKADTPLSSGTTVRLPADACVQGDDSEPVKPLPMLRPKPASPRTRVLPLTGTYQCSLDEKGQLTLPRSLRDQLGGSETVLLSPGPDKCLWLTNQPHLERLGERLEQSQASEADVRVFKRLYFAQTEKLAVNGDGRVAVPERLAQFAGLHQEVVLVGIDDHFEVWDAARWRHYTQQKSAVSRTATSTEQE
jgi:MraZ protein